MAVDAGAGRAHSPPAALSCLTLIYLPRLPTSYHHRHLCTLPALFCTRSHTATHPLPHLRICTLHFLPAYTTRILPATCLPRTAHTRRELCLPLLTASACTLRLSPARTPPHREERGSTGQARLCLYIWRACVAFSLHFSACLLPSFCLPAFWACLSIQIHRGQQAAWRQGNIAGMRETAWQNGKREGCRRNESSDNEKMAATTM